MQYCEHNECKILRQRWMRQQRNVVARGDELRELLEKHNYRVKWSNHSDDREELRVIAPWQSKQALDDGDCIAFSVYQDQKYGLTYKWTWLGYAKVGVGRYRPIHLVLLVNPANPSRKILVGTVYDPSVKYWMWDETYSIRVCWKDRP